MRREKARLQKRGISEENNRKEWDPELRLEVVYNDRLCILKLMFRVLGSFNDLNVMEDSTSFRKVRAET